MYRCRREGKKKRKSKQRSTSIVKEFPPHPARATVFKDRWTKRFPRVREGSLWPSPPFPFTAGLVGKNRCQGRPSLLSHCPSREPPENESLRVAPPPPLRRGVFQLTLPRSGGCFPVCDKYNNLPRMSELLSSLSVDF